MKRKFHRDRLRDWLGKTRPCCPGPKIRWAALAGLVAGALMAGSVGAAESDVLQIGADGGFVRAGKPFRGVGVNYYDVFQRTLASEPRTNHHLGFAELATRQIPFARFSAGGYWPADWALYRTNRVGYFAQLEAIVKSAERQGIGLVPSLFWSLATVPDLVGEPVSAWGDPKSRTQAFMREYTTEVVTRWRDSPAIWAWEFGNEYNLPADLPNAADHRPAVVVSLGTPSTRSARDEVTHEQIRVALREFARQVRTLDPKRAIFSGNAFPRPSAWHQKSERRWTADSPDQWKEMLAGDNPDPVNTLTGRLYSASDRVALGWAMSASRSLGKPLFVGEFGVPGDPTVAARAEFQALLDLLERERVQMAALWVYDFDGQAADWNVTAANARRDQLDAIAALNRRWRDEAQ